MEAWLFRAKRRFVRTKNTIKFEKVTISWPCGDDYFILFPMYFLYCLCSWSYWHLKLQPDVENVRWKSEVLDRGFLNNIVVLDSIAIYCNHSDNSLKPHACFGGWKKVLILNHQSLNPSDPRSKQKTDALGPARFASWCAMFWTESSHCSCGGRPSRQGKAEWF